MRWNGGNGEGKEKGIKESRRNGRDFSRFRSIQIRIDRCALTFSGDSSVINRETIGFPLPLLHFEVFRRFLEILFRESDAFFFFFADAYRYIPRPVFLVKSVYRTSLSGSSAAFSGFEVVNGHRSRKTRSFPRFCLACDSVFVDFEDCNFFLPFGCTAVRRRNVAMIPRVLDDNERFCLQIRRILICALWMRKSAEIPVVSASDWSDPRLILSRSNRFDLRFSQIHQIDM